MSVCTEVLYNNSNIQTQTIASSSLNEKCSAVVYLQTCLIYLFIDFFKDYIVYKKIVPIKNCTY